MLSVLRARVADLGSAPPVGEAAAPPGRPNGRKVVLHKPLVVGKDSTPAPNAIVPDTMEARWLSQSSAYGKAFDRLLFQYPELVADLDETGQAQLFKGWVSEQERKASPRDYGAALLREFALIRTHPELNETTQTAVFWKWYVVVTAIEGMYASAPLSSTSLIGSTDNRPALDVHCWTAFGTTPDYRWLFRRL
ncbi:hypothetical protein B0H19DRAFT_113339 [Mycena capillaripes]|nr:hypothetical protein B0H19DRAFT_113339 [Mycena capillaripes]